MGFEKRTQCGYLVLVWVLSSWLAAALAKDPALEECKSAASVANVRELGQIPQHDYGRPGLSHMTVWGAKHHDMKELEVWLQSFVPGSGTPIHRHDCEEVFVVEAGEATYLEAGFDDNSGGKAKPGRPVESRAAANSTFRVPPNAVHQVRNLHPTLDLRVLVIISKPPIRVYVYETWEESHADAVLSFPYPWDRVCPEELESRQTLESREL